MSDQEELRIRRAIRDASQSGDSGAELKARRELKALLSGGPPPQPAPVAPPAPAPPAFPEQSPQGAEAGAGLPMDPNAITPPAYTGPTELQRAGIFPGSAPAGVRAAASFGLDELESYKRAFGDQYDVTKVTDEGPLKGEIIFSPKGKNEWRSVRGAGQGIGLGDIASLAGEAIPTATSTVGGIVGAFSPASPGVGAVAGTGVGSFVGELARIAEGRRRGIIPPETSGREILLSAMQRSGLDMLGAAGGTVAYNLYRSFVGRGLPDLGIDPEEYRRALADLRQSVPAELAGTITPGSVVGATPRGAVVSEAESRLAAQVGESGDRMREILQARERAGRELVERELPQTPAAPAATTVGEMVESAAPTPGRGLDLALPGRVVSPDVPGTGERVRTTVEQAFDTAIAVPKATMDRVAAAARSVTPRQPYAAVLPIETNQAILSLASDFDERVLGSLSQDTRRVVNDWFEEAFGPPDPRTGIRELRQLDFDTIADGISSIREAKRRLFKGEWGGKLEELTEIEDALVADRNRLLEMLPNGRRLLNELVGSERQYRTLQDAYRRGAISDLFRHKVGGQEVISPARITARLFENPETAAMIGGILRRDPAQRQTLAAVQATLKWEALQAAVVNRQVRADALEKWVNTNEVVLGSFFSPNEIARLRQVPNLERMRKAMGVSGEDFNPSAWFGKFWNSSDARQAAVTMNRLRQQDPQTAEAVRGLTRQYLYNQITKEGEQATGRALDTDALVNMLNTPGRAEWLNTVLDPGFSVRLRALSDAMRAVAPRAQAINIPAQAGEPTAIGTLRRAGRVGLGVLSTQARVFNSLLTISEERIRARVAEALLDPDRFADLLGAARRTPQGVATAATIGQALLGGDLDTQAIGSLTGGGQ